MSSSTRAIHYRTQSVSTRLNKNLQNLSCMSLCARTIHYRTEGVSTRFKNTNSIEPKLYVIVGKNIIKSGAYLLVFKTQTLRNLSYMSSSAKTIPYGTKGRIYSFEIHKLYRTKAVCPRLQEPYLIIEPSAYYSF